MGIQLLRAITGYREDLDLGGRWWHRLVLVTYAVSLALLTAATLWMVVSSTRPARDVRNVRVLTTLRVLFQEKHPPLVNLAERLADQEGAEFGVRRPEGQIDYVNPYFLRRSFCTTAALQAPEAVADYFDRVNYTRDNTAASVQAGTLKGLVPGEDGVCWFDDTIQKLLDANVNNEVIAYEFTGAAVARAAAWPLAKAAGALALLHVLAATLYYRGFIYVVCGSRRRNISALNAQTP